MISLLEFLESVKKLSPELKHHLDSIIRQENFLKHQFLLRDGEVSSHIYFIDKGFTRAFNNFNGKPTTNWFMKEMDIIVSVKSFFRREKSSENIEAIEDTLVSYISYDELENTYDSFPEFNIVGRKILTHYYIQCEERINDLRNKNAVEKHTEMLLKFPDIYYRAPLGNIASYLGITLETLSRIRSAQ